MRRCPPARTLASGPRRASSAIAWSRVVAFSYSKCAGTCMSASLRNVRIFVLARRLGNRVISDRSSPLSERDNAARMGVVTLTQLGAFVLVARLGSVKAAATALGVSEPAVSQALAALR